MKILLLGSGGREHALAWKISQSSNCSGLFIAPGNAGTAGHGTNVPLQLNDFSSIGSFCVEEDIAMVIVGPEEPLVNGIKDFFTSSEELNEIMVIGPSQQGAKLEGSKAFAKAFMHRHQVPTAAYREFDSSSYELGLEYLQQHRLPVVIKADGLAAGKGVLICETHAAAKTAFESMILNNKFGEAGKKVVIEQFLSGIEMSVFVLTDGRHYVLLPEAKDYKRIGEGDTGLNTGGMGAVSPVPFAGQDFMQKVEERVVIPTIQGLMQENIDYTGIIFIGLIKVNGEPFVIEYNCRLGDPETEVIIPRLQNDLVELFRAAAEKRLDTAVVQTDSRTACTVVAVSGGYPGEFSKGFPIYGLSEPLNDNSLIFQSATRQQSDSVITAGGRVLCVTSYGDSVGQAVNRSKIVLEKIRFEAMYFRHDIGYEFS